MLGGRANSNGQCKGSIKLLNQVKDGYIYDPEKQSK